MPEETKKEEDVAVFDEATKDAAKKYLSLVGTLGGRKTAKKGPDFYRKIQKKSVASRMKKKQDRLLDE